VRHWDTQGQAIQFALQGGDHLPNRPCGARGRGDNVQAGMPGTAKVFVGRIHQPLIRRKRMHGGQQAPLDAKRLVQHKRHGSRTVRRTAGVAQDPGVVRYDVVIDPKHHRAFEIVPGGHRDEDTSGASVQVMLQLMEAQELAGAVNHIVHAQLAPGEFGRVSLAEDLKGIVVNYHGMTVEAYFTRVHPMDAVILKDIGEVLRIGEIVDGHHIEVVTHFGNPGDDASNTTKTIDRNFWHSHCSLLWSMCKALGCTLLWPDMSFRGAYKRSVNSVQRYYEIKQQHVVLSTSVVRANLNPKSTPEHGMKDAWCFSRSRPGPIVVPSFQRIDFCQAVTVPFFSREVCAHKGAHQLPCEFRPDDLRPHH